MSHSTRLGRWLLVLSLFALVTTFAFAQETTAGLQGTVKDPTGAVVAKATVEVSGPALIGTKKVQTDAAGYYRFANLPPGDYTLTVSASGFRTTRQSGIDLSVGRLPTVDVALQVGTVAETVEVTGAAPIVDVTQSKVATTVAAEVIDHMPKGRNFESLINFAPGARQEPLQTGRSARPSGFQTGFQIDGASDAENTYLVEGQNVTDPEVGGLVSFEGLRTVSIPTEFVGEVQIKSSGFEAEHGGALGGVVNIIQKRGGNAWHGSLFAKAITDAANANDQCDNPGDSGLALQQIFCGQRFVPGTERNTSLRIDQPIEYYIQKKDHHRILQPGFDVGGPVAKDRLWLFVSYAPEIDRRTRAVDYFSALNAPSFFQPSPNPGLYSFTRSRDAHNALSRVDYKMFNSLRLFGSWQYGYSRVSGRNFPRFPDSAIGQPNSTASNDPAVNRQDTGYVAPSQILNFGGDWSVSNKLVVASRYGYYYTNVADRGKPSGIRYVYGSDLSNATADAFGNPINAGAFANASGFFNIPDNFQNVKDTYTRKSFNTDVSYYATKFGTHNLKAGYALNRLANTVTQFNSTALVQLNWGQVYTPGTPAGQAACAQLEATFNGNCQGQFGYVILRDGVNVFGKVHSLNHALYFQDSWTHKGLTINGGIRFDKETLPPYDPGAFVVQGVKFGFGDKIAPRIGGAYDLLHNGKVKLYASYGRFFDIMKYNLPRGSLGGNYWHDCVYALNGLDFRTIVPGNDSNGNFCPPSGPGIDVPPNSGIVGPFIENQNFRLNLDNARFSVIDPNIKPMEQWAMDIGTDWAITPTLGLELRYSRKRLVNTIEDMAITDALGFYIGNPGSAFTDLLQRQTVDPDNPDDLTAFHPIECADCPLQPKAIRRYDGLEFRLTKRASDRWYGSLSYTYSKLTGNYSGLTSTDITDAQGGRNNPNTNRAFDAPEMQFTAHGTFQDGRLPTDRPHALKLFGWYALKYWGQETTIGFSQSAFAGTPVSTCWGAFNTQSSCVFVENRGNWVNLHRDPTTTLLVSDGVIRDRRVPWYTQTDLSFLHEFKVSKTRENYRLGFEWNVQNLFNQRATIALYENPINTAVRPAGTSPSGVDWHAFTDRGWDYIAVTNAKGGAMLDSRYGQPVMFQVARNMRFKLKFTF